MAQVLEGTTLYFILGLVLCTLVNCQNNRTVGSDRDAKVFSLFQLVKFKNEPCVGSTSKNGTCYTQDECKAKSGSASGSCASGYGVCCTFSLDCGATSAENCTYLTQTSTSAFTASPCTYKICKSDPEVCRIRFEFNTFQIGDQTVGTAMAGTAISTNGDAIGECQTDQFSITSPGKVAPPVICGYNSGQHMIVDASDACHLASFALSGSAPRSWDIKVTQYKCGNVGLAGHEGCLQYFNGPTGTVASFGYPTQSMTVAVTTTHLSNQCYSICWRQERGYCGICFTPFVSESAIEVSFGISNPLKQTAKGELDNACMTDHLMIPDLQENVAGQKFPIVTAVLPGVPLRDRVCGRHFNAAPMGVDRQTSGTICTQSRPFRITFKTDDSEVTVGNMQANKNEQSELPGGIVGFHLHWEQQMC